MSNVETDCNSFLERSRFNSTNTGHKLIANLTENNPGTGLKVANEEIKWRSKECTIITKNEQPFRNIKQKP